MKLSRERFNELLHEFITHRGRMVRLIVATMAVAISRQARAKSKSRDKAKFSLKRPNIKLNGFTKKRGRMVRLIVAIMAVALLCVILSGSTLIQLTSDYQPSDTNQVTDPDSVAPDYPEIKPISNVGRLKTIGIGAYWDAGLTNGVDFMDWGVLEPGDRKSFLIYFQNEGNFPVSLSKSTSSWNPSVAARYLSLSWDYNSQIIEASKNLTVTLTLSVSKSIIGVTDFSFDIIIVGTG